MTSTHPQERRCAVYHGSGEPNELAIELEPVERERPYLAPLADRVSLRAIMSQDLICARQDLEITALVGLMMKHRLGCMPVVDDQRRPIGMITKFDIVEQLDAAMRSSMGGYPLPADLTAQTADDLMMPVVLALDEHATIAHASEMMVSGGTHHILATDQHGALVGVVSAKDIVGWVIKNDVLAVRRDASCGPPIWHPLEG